MTPKVPASIGGVLSQVFALLMRLATEHPSAIPVVLKLIKAAFESGDPVRAIRRAAMSAAAQEAAKKTANAVLKGKARR